MEEHQILDICPRWSSPTHLHLNEYKISGPTVPWNAADDESIRQLISGHGYDVYFVEGDDPMTMHRAFAETLETCYTENSPISKRGSSAWLYEDPTLARYHPT